MKSAFNLLRASLYMALTKKPVTFVYRDHDEIWQPNNDGSINIMQIDRHTKMVQPYKTKIERIWECEDALIKIASGTLTAQEAVDLAASLKRTDGRWRKKSPRSFSEIDALQKAGK